MVVKNFFVMFCLGCSFVLASSDIAFSAQGNAKAHFQQGDSDLFGVVTGLQAEGKKSRLFKQPLSFEAGVTLSQPIVEGDDGDLFALGDARLNNNGESIGGFYFHKLNLSYEDKNWRVKFFRQTIKANPLVGVGSSEFMPNAYEGLTYKNRMQKGYVLDFAYLTAMVGKDSHLALRDNFNSITSAIIGSSVESSPLIYLGTKKSYDEGYARAYAYYIPEFDSSANKESLTSLYIDYRGNKLKIPQIAEAVELQLLSSSYTSKSSFTLLGGKLDLGLETSTFTNNSLALSVVAGDEQGVAYHFGANPEFTKTNEFSLEDIGVAQMGLKLSSDVIVPNPHGILLDLALALYMGKDKAGTYSSTTVKNANVVELNARGVLSEKTGIGATLAYQDLEAISGQSVDDRALFTLSASYKF